VFALGVYILAAGAADLIVLGHLRGSVDLRLATRLAAIAKTVPKNGEPPASSAVPLNSRDLGNPPAGGDLDDAPVLAWWIPTGGRASALESGAPAFPPSRASVTDPIDATIAGRPFRLRGVSFPRGHLVVATSIEQSIDVRNNLLIAEGALLPVMLLTFFLIATLIGRRAAAPIERARRQQLDFTADASHELRTPLSVIEAEVGLALSAQRSGPAYRASLERVAQESERLRSIVNDLLWLARLDAIPSAPPSERVDLVALAEGCASRFRPIAEARNLTITVGSPPDGASAVNAPADWLDRLVSVLVDNACRYTEDGGRIEITVETTEGRTSLTVADSGPGIAEADRPEVLQRFHRASAAPGGAGLGLSIADTIVRSTGGRWDIGRAAIGGAQMRISWPRPHGDGGRHALAPSERVGGPPRVESEQVG